MTARTFHEQVFTRQAVHEYLDENGMTSLQKIAAYVFETTRYDVPTSTIAELVREYGYTVTEREDSE